MPIDGIQYQEAAAEPTVQSGVSPVSVWYQAKCHLFVNVADGEE